MKSRSTLMISLILFIFFVISFLTNILGPIIPDIIKSFSLGLGMAGFLPFSFFVAYGIMSVPAGLLIEKYSEKKVILFAFLLALIGALLFAMFPIFAVALPSLFLIGIGMAMLQVAINPLLRQSGGEENFAFYSVLAQFVFGLASFLSPQLYSYLVNNLHTTKTSFILNILNPIVPQQLEWASLYWVFAAMVVLVIIVIAIIRFPKVELTADEKIETGKAFSDLLRNKQVILFFVGIFAYVGTEQGIANWASKFLQTYHGIDPATKGADVISYFWGLLTLGCLLGLVLLKLIDSRKVLIVFAIGAIISLAFALFGTAEIAIYAFPVSGFFLSVMWGVIFSLGLNSVAMHHGTYSGILCTAILGGAVVPLLIGGIADLIGLRFAMVLLFVTLGYILSIGIWAKPLVTNKTIQK
ncbi:MAG: MFS transporter [Bacteroidales bacterium]